MLGGSEAAARRAAADGIARLRATLGRDDRSRRSRHERRCSTASPAPDVATLDRRPRRRSRRAPSGEGLLDVAYRTSTARSARCCWPPRPTGWCASRSRARATTPCCDAPGDRGQPADPARAGAPRRRGAPARRVLRRPPPHVRRAGRPAARHGFRREVLEHLRAIPYGATASYAVVAGASGRRAPCGRPARRAPQPGARRRAVPPRRAQRRIDRPVPRRRRGQAGAAGPGGGVTGDRRARLAGHHGGARRARLRRRRAGARRRRRAASSPRLYDDDDRFRSTIDMARHRFGAGQYRYFAHPLPRRRRPSCGPRSGRTCCRSPGTGRRARRAPAPWPDRFDDWLAMCHDAGQRRPTPLLLRYGPGDWNAPAPRPLRRARVPAAGRGRPRRARSRLQRRRVRRRRAATAGPVAGDDDADRPRPGARVHDARPPRALVARAGPPRRCATASASCAPAAAAPSASSSTTRPDALPSEYCVPSEYVGAGRPRSSTRTAPGTRMAVSGRRRRGPPAAPGGRPASGRGGASTPTGPPVRRAGSGCRRSSSRRGGTPDRRARPTRAAWRPGARPRGRTEYGDTAVWA